MVVALAAVSAAPARASSNDPFLDRQWALEQIGAPRAWTVTRGAGILIGIVDSGVEAGHPDLVGKVAFTADCFNRPVCADGLGGTDVDGHGTLIAGVAAAATDNGRGVAGVAPDARLAVAKVLGAGGGGRAEDINHGIHWAVDHGARVVNISLGDPGSLTSAGGSPLKEGIDYAWSKGAVPVLAAGNYGGVSSENYGTLNALVVGATDRTGAVASYSSAIGNAKWGLVAPGGSGVPGPDNNIISTASRRRLRLVGGDVDGGAPGIGRGRPAAGPGPEPVGGGGEAAGRPRPGAVRPRLPGPAQRGRGLGRGARPAHHHHHQGLVSGGGGGGLRPDHHRRPAARHDGAAGAHHHDDSRTGGGAGGPGGAGRPRRPGRGPAVAHALRRPASDLRGRGPDAGRGRVGGRGVGPTTPHPRQPVPPPVGAAAVTPTTVTSSAPTRRIRPP